VTQIVQGLPDLEVIVDDRPLALPSSSGVARVDVHLALSAPGQLDLVLDDPGLGVADKLPPGANIEIRVSSHVRPLFAGDITACEYVYGPLRRHQLRVRGYERLHRLRRRRPVRVHEAVTVADLTRGMASEIGLGARADGPLPAWPFLIQSRQSDLDLLVDLAARCGRYVVQDGGDLALVDLAGAGPPIALALGDDLVEATFEVNGEWACREVRVSGWNPLAVEDVAGSAGSPRVALTAEARVDPARLGGDGRWPIIDETVPSDEHARALAQAELDSRAAQEVTLRGAALGDPALRPGAIVDVSGAHPHVAGRYVLTEVHHAVDTRRGFITELSSAPPVRRARPSGTIVALGRVSRVDDPDNLGRVRVTLPAWDGVETDWMGVLALGAGSGKGLTILPDVGDTVLVQLFREDPGRGVVMGGLYGAGGSPDAGVEGNGVQRFTLVSAGGQRITVDDKRQSLRFEDKSGSYLDLGPENVTLHAARPMVLEAPGLGVVIRGRTVDFEQK
jgi:phage baseplate assembly protein gpV/phage protein D